jgi:hypothetical protein
MLFYEEKKQHHFKKNWTGERTIEIRKLARRPVQQTGAGSLRSTEPVPVLYPLNLHTRVKLVP